MNKKEACEGQIYLKCKDRQKEVQKKQRAGGDESEEGGIPHSERDARHLLEKMKGYFNWVSDACLILFSY